METRPANAKHPSGRLVHEFLAHSYFMYLAAVVVGLGADLLWPVDFSFPYISSIGFFSILAGTAVIIWSQHASRKGSHARNQEGDKICRDHFCVGPYVFTRTPTQYGLSLLVLGLAMLYSSFFMLLASVVAFLVARFIFIPLEEKHLEHKYGDAFTEYKKHVKF